MQLERPMRLAAYLLGPDSARSTLPTEAECEAAPPPRSYYLRRPMPLHVRYATCAVVAGSCGFTPMSTGAMPSCGASCFRPRAPCSSGPRATTGKGRRLGATA